MTKKLNLEDVAEQLRRNPGTINGRIDPRTISRVCAGHSFMISTFNKLLENHLFGDAYTLLWAERGKLSIRDFAEKIGYSPKLLYDIFSGRRSPDAILEKLGYRELKLWQKE